MPVRYMMAHKGPTTVNAPWTTAFQNWNSFTYKFSQLICRFM